MSEQNAGDAEIKSEGAEGGGAELEQASPSEATNQGDLHSRVERVIEDHINPAVAMHGGFVSLVEVEGTRVFIAMGGGCQGCAASSMTLRMGIEAMIMEEVPEVSEVVDATDHAAGANPYYG